LISSITEELVNGSDVALVGFVTYKVNDRAARSGRNPQAGEIQNAVEKVPALKASKALKDAVNG